MTQRSDNPASRPPPSEGPQGDLPTPYPPPAYRPAGYGPDGYGQDGYGPDSYGAGGYGPDGYGAGDFAPYGYRQPGYPGAPPAPSAPAPAPPMDRVSVMLREVLQITLPAIVLAIIVHLFLAQATVVFGQSMEPNLHSQQRLIVDKLSLRFHAPVRNDIVVIDLPSMDDMLVKRIVGLPGETVEVRDGVVLVDGAPLAEPFPHDLGHTSMAPVVLGPLEYFVMGDNRDNSNDSRAFGPVLRKYIVGRVWLRYWPLNEFHLF